MLGRRSARSRTSSAWLATSSAPPLSDAQLAWAVDAAARAAEPAHALRPVTIADGPGDAMHSADGQRIDHLFDWVPSSSGSTWMRSHHDRATERRVAAGASRGGPRLRGSLVFTAATGASFGLVQRREPRSGPDRAATLTMATVGVLLAIRVPANLMGWLLLVSAVVSRRNSWGSCTPNGADQLRRIAGRPLPPRSTATSSSCRSRSWSSIPLIYPNGRLLAALAVAGGGADLVARHVYRKDGASARSDIRHDHREPVRHRESNPC